MTHRFRILSRLPLLLILLLGACGGSSGNGGHESPAVVRTLAYVVTECHEDAAVMDASSAQPAVFSLRQTLQVLRADQPPVTVAEIPPIEAPAAGICPLLASFRDGTNSVFVGALQRLGVTPDGSGVVFEVTFEFSVLTQMGLPNPLTPEQEGIFYVRADGSGLRRLGPPSREPAQRLLDLSAAYDIPFFGFSPSGRTVTFTDRGPDPHEHDAPQIAVLDVATGIRRLLTQLSDVPPDDSNPAVPATTAPSFLDETTVIFSSRSPDGTPHIYTVKTDGTELTALPPLVAGGGGIVPTYSITQPITGTGLATLDMPGTPVNPDPDHPEWGILELFSINKDQLLQLTNFRRIDTGTFNGTTDGRRVFFTASVDPFGCNPTNTCQFFSMDVLGDPTTLRQLTDFKSDGQSTVGCGLPLQQPPAVGCTSRSGPVLDLQTDALAFNSTCDPLGLNPDGQQYFVMRTDGSGLRQLTTMRGVRFADDGSIDFELPGPGACSAPGGWLF